MELDLPTLLSRLLSLEWHPRTTRHTHRAKVVKVVDHHLNISYWLALVGKNCNLIQGKEGGIEVLAGLATSSQTVGSNERTPRSHQRLLLFCQWITSLKSVWVVAKWVVGWWIVSQWVFGQSIVTTPYHQASNVHREFWGRIHNTSFSS